MEHEQFAEEMSADAGRFLIDEFDEIDQRLQALSSVLTLGANYNEGLLEPGQKRWTAFNMNLMKVMSDYVESIRALLDDTARDVLIRTKKPA